MQDSGAKERLPLWLVCYKREDSYQAVCRLPLAGASVKILSEQDGPFSSEKAVLVGHCPPDLQLCLLPPNAEMWGMCTMERGTLQLSTAFCVPEKAATTVFAAIERPLRAVCWQNSLVQNWQVTLILCWYADASKTFSSFPKPNRALLYAPQLLPAFMRSIFTGTSSRLMQLALWWVQRLDKAVGGPLPGLVMSSGTGSQSPQVQFQAPYDSEQQKGCDVLLNFSDIINGSKGVLRRRRAAPAEPPFFTGNIVNMRTSVRARGEPSAVTSAYPGKQVAVVMRRSEGNPTRAYCRC